MALCNIVVSISLYFSKTTKKKQQWRGGYLSRRLEIRKVKKANYSLKEEIFVNLYLIYSSSLGKIFVFLACMQESLSCEKCRYSVHEV